MIYKNFIIVFILGLSFGFYSMVLAQNGPANNQIVSRDAIGLRVVPNPEHLSPLQWYYQNIDSPGSPQSMLVDGYEAVRDGRTVYVSAANIVSVKRCPDLNVCNQDNQCGNINPNGSLPSKLIPTAWAAFCEENSSYPKELFTNVYIISYSQDPEPSTTDILGQILQYWKFNIDVKNCSWRVTQACSNNRECPTINQTCSNGFCSEKTSQACSTNSDCSSISQICGSAGFCNSTMTKSCIIDSDCPQGEYCNSKKSTIIRDTKRLIDLRDVKNELELYNARVKTYPVLDNGTYLANRTISTWPSWSETFGSTMRSPIPTDAINKLGRCRQDAIDNRRFEASTCWDDKVKEFSATADPLALPANSRAYYYQYKKSDNSFRFCAIFESGYVQAKPPLSPICQTGKSCVIKCAGRKCGNDGCGGSCGKCISPSVCDNTSGQCVR